MVKPDLTGEPYRELLERFHRDLVPKSYIEIGTLDGRTLALSTCATIAIDPKFIIESGSVVVNKPICHLFQMSSDDFFAGNDPVRLFGRPIDLAFLDGMHRCEFLLRDFLNTERSCKRNSVILLHDCVPVEEPMTHREQGAAPPILEHRTGWWTGDVWRTVQALKRFRSDLTITAYDAPPTGVVAVTNLNPSSTELTDNYQNIVHEMLSWKLDLDRYFLELHVESTAVISSHEKITGRFWL